MARPSLVTRTLVYSSIACTVVVIDENGAHSDNRVFTLSKVHLNNAKTLNLLRKMYETDSLKIAAIVTITYVKENRKMTEEYFIEHSEVVSVEEISQDALEYTE